METRIFELGLSVEAVSLYILLDYFGEFAKDISLDDVRTKWSSSESILERSLDELDLQSVISRQPGDVIHLTPSSRWKVARQS
ncbi:MAG: hypothetical protein PHO79_05615 [Desulfoplanes sp.]|jgi:hypothetical protein|nr:hypothetical protein [Desulfoplanes sp.]MDD4649481.1 hypothetical protein [Desulfoplanes sp.]